MKALLCLVGLAAIPMTAAHALHYPGHFEGSTPRQADHSGICENYEKITRTRKLSKAERKKLDRQYKKNCRSQSGSSPPSPVQAPDNSSNSDSQNPSIAAFTMPRCLKNDTPVEVSGQSLKSGGLNCSVGSRTLKPSPHPRIVLSIRWGLPSANCPRTCNVKCLATKNANASPPVKKRLASRVRYRPESANRRRRRTATRRPIWLLKSHRKA